MILSHAPSHTPSFAPAGQEWGERAWRLVGAGLICYLMPVILFVLIIGTIWMVLGAGWRLLGSRG